VVLCVVPVIDRAQDARTGDSKPPELIDYVVATVNGAPITWSALELERRVRGLSREEALDALIDQRLFLEEAAKFVIVSQGEVDRRLGEVRTGGGVGLVESARRLMLEGAGEAELRERIRQQLTLDQLVARMFRPQADKATPAEVEEYYQTRATELLTPTRYRTRRIHLDLPKAASDQDKREVRSRIERIGRDLASGRLTMEALRSAVADDERIVIQADDVWRTAYQHALELSDVVSKLPVGEWSEPVSTPLGFFLIQITAVRAPERRTLDDALYREIATRIEAVRLQSIMQDWIEERRAESDIRSLNGVGDPEK